MSLPHEPTDALSERLRKARIDIYKLEGYAMHEKQPFAYQRAVRDLVPELATDLLEAKRYEDMMELLEEFVLELGNDICMDLHDRLRSYRKDYIHPKRSPEQRKLYDQFGTVIDSLAEEVGDISLASDASEDEHAELANSVIEQMKESADPDARLMALVEDGQRTIKRCVRQHMRDKENAKKRKHAGQHEPAKKRKDRHDDDDDGEYVPE